MAACRRGAAPALHPDFASFLLQAQTSKAQVIGLANGGDDTINAIKQAAEFGIMRGGQKLAGLVIVARWPRLALIADTF